MLSWLLRNNMWGFDHSCEEHVWLWYRLNGRTRSGFNLMAYYQILAMFFNDIFITYKLLFTELEDSRFVLHFQTLSYFYTGILWTVFYKVPKVTWLARECDRFVGLDSPEDKALSGHFNKRFRWSKHGYGQNLLVLQTFNIAFIIAVRPLVLHLVAGAPRELIFSGQEESTLKFWGLYMAQASFMFTALVTIPVNTQLLYRISFHMMIKYKLLHHRLARLTYDESLPPAEAELKLNSDVRKCIKHHQHLLEIFTEFKKVCSYSFTFSYFGLFMCIGLTRSALVGENPDYKQVPDFITESLYLFYQCFCLTDLPDMSDSVLLSIYENDWFWFPRSTIKMLHIMGIRSRRLPHVPLYPGGSPAILHTYGMLMNASMAYFMSAILL